MNQLITRGIVLTRTDYGEADRIVTFLTPDYGKLRLMARGVRKPKSKLAGGIELFSVSELSFIRGRGEIGTLTSARLHKHYGNIVKHIDRVQLGYDLLKLLNRVTEDEPEVEYFTLLEQVLAALDKTAVDLDLIRLWFTCQLLRLAGHAPNLTTDVAGHKLTADSNYDFDLDTMTFTPQPDGNFTPVHVKFLRLLFDQHTPQALQKINNLEALLGQCLSLTRNMAVRHLNSW